jgi:hypothetical protein
MRVAEAIEETYLEVVMVAALKTEKGLDAVNSGKMHLVKPTRVAV